MNEHNGHIIHEITPLSDKDCFYIADRRKSEFTYPLHSHSEFEINYIENAEGVRRIVGDSVEIIGKYDLTLIAGEELEHVWEQHQCTSKNIREITIQFSKDLFSAILSTKISSAVSGRCLTMHRKESTFLWRLSWRSIRCWTHFLRRSRVYAVIRLLTILYELSLCDNYHTLASSSFAHIQEKLTVEGCAGFMSISINTIGKRFGWKIWQTLWEWRRWHWVVFQTQYRENSFRSYYWYPFGQCYPAACGYHQFNRWNLLWLRI